MTLKINAIIASVVLHTIFILEFPQPKPSRAFAKEALVLKASRLSIEGVQLSRNENNIAQHVADKSHLNVATLTIDPIKSDNFRGYYDSVELDTIPAPIQQWNIDKDRISKESLLGLELEVTLWVDDLGNIRKIHLENVDQLTVDVEWILNSIRLTKLAPATIRNTPVPCIITFSIVLGE